MVMSGRGKPAHGVTTVFFEAWFRGQSFEPKVSEPSKPRSSLIVKNLSLLPVPICYDLALLLPRTSLECWTVARVCGWWLSCGVKHQPFPMELLTGTLPASLNSIKFRGNVISSVSRKVNWVHIFSVGRDGPSFWFPNHKSLGM